MQMKPKQGPPTPFLGKGAGGGGHFGGGAMGQSGPGPGPGPGGPGGLNSNMAPTGSMVGGPGDFGNSMGGWNQASTHVHPVPSILNLLE